MTNDESVTADATSSTRPPVIVPARRQLDLRWLAAGVSIFLSALRFALDPVINNDGILYLRAAEFFEAGDWEAGSALFKWPFYSFMVGQLSRLTGLDVEIAAHVLEAALSATIVAAFVSIVREALSTGALGAQARRIEGLAVLTILGYSTLNDYRADITRDTGYLAFYMVALLFFFRFVRRPAWTSAAGWGLAISVAVLFRIEGVVFWLLLPCALLFRRPSPGRHRWREFACAHTILLAFVATLAIALTLPGVRDAETLSRLELEEPWTRLKLFVLAIGNLPEKAAPLVGTVLPKQSADHAVPILLLSLAYVLVVETLMALTPLHLILVGHAARKRLLFPAEGFLRSWLWCVAISFGLLLVYVPPRALLTGRYPLALCLTLLVAVPFSLANLYEKWRAAKANGRPTPTRWQRWAFPLAAVFLAAGAVDGLVSFGATKHHLREAGAWIRSQPGEDKRVFTNDKILGYYAGQRFPQKVTGDDWEATRAFLENGSHSDYDFVALRFRRRRDSQAAWAVARVGEPPIQEFRNRRGDRVLVFEVSDFRGTP